MSRYRPPLAEQDDRILDVALRGNLKITARTALSTGRHIIARKCRLANHVAALPGLRLPRRFSEGALARGLVQAGAATLLPAHASFAALPFFVRDVFPLQRS